jgi:hypothetical protein
MPANAALLGQRGSRASAESHVGLRKDVEFFKSQQNMLKTRSLKVTCKQEIAHVVKSAVLLTIVVVSRKLAEEPLNTGAAGRHGKHLTGHLLLVVVHLVL